MDFELPDVILILFPLMILDIFLSSRKFELFSNKRLKFPFILISYNLVFFTPIFILLSILFIRFNNSYSFSLDDFTSDIITDITTLDFDFFTMLMISWSLFIIYTSAIISQLALRILKNLLTELEINSQNLNERLDNVTKSLLNENKISLHLIISSKFGFIFSFSYYSFIQKHNFIYISEEISNNFSNEELNSAIIHEIGHIINKDTIYRPIFNAICKLMFFDPILKRISKHYNDKIEKRADAFALQYISKSDHLINAILKVEKLINTDFLANIEIDTYGNSLIDYRVFSNTLLVERLSNLTRIEEN